MKKKISLVAVILVLILSCTMLFLFSGCTKKPKPIYVEIWLINPFTGEELEIASGHSYTYFEFEMKGETLIQAKFKNKATGEYLTEEEIEPVKESIHFSVTSSNPGEDPSTVGNKYWPTKVGGYGVSVFFDSFIGREYYDKFIPTSATWDVKIKKVEKI
ncbi:MAG: hypothetical protein RR033_03575 [Clostridia bacterium]